MRALWPIITREYAAYFATPLAYVFIIVFLCACGFATFYLGNYFEMGRADLSGFFVFHPWLYLLFLPAIAMRLWAEERRAGTEELWLTLPLPLWSVVLGKFIAAWGFAATALALTFPIWLTVNYLGAPDNGVILAGYLGSLFMAGGYLAIGSFASALTRNQVIAFTLAVVVSFLFTVAGLPLVLDVFRLFLPQILVETIASFSFLTHFSAISGGVIDLRDAIYFAVLIFCFLAATIVVVDSGRGRARARPASAFALLVVLCVSVNLFASISFRHARFDLTENRLFTLSAGARNILAALTEPVTLRFYYTRRTMTDQPAMQAYAQRVRDMLEEMTAAAKGRLVLQIIEPQPFSESEDLAVQQGLVAQPTPDGRLIYFGLVGTNLVDNVEIIPFFADERQEYLEYDLARLIVNLDRPRKPVLGVLSNLPLDTGTGGLVAAMQGRSQPFLIYRELVDRFAVQFLDQKLTKIPSNIDVLLLAHPRPLVAQTLYAIDQFALRGGRVIVFIDPHSEISLTAGEGGAPLPGHTQESNLPKLLARWGVDMPQDKILADRARALRVQTDRDARRALEDYVVWLGVTAAELNGDDLVTANIDSLNLASSGVLIRRADATTRFTPLVTSSHEAAPIDRALVRAGATPQKLARALTPDGVRHVIAARLSGRIETAFADGAPAKRADAPPHIAASDKANIIVFADSDIFDDRLWVREQNYLGQVFGVPIADNAKFLLNAVENMMGSNNLISLRGRERAFRPFTRVEALRRRAEAQYLDEETRLRARLAEVQTALDRVERDAKIEDAAQLTAQYRTELVRTRKALRGVQAALRRDIERLGAWVTWLNIAAMPLILIGLALLLARRRAVKRLKTQKAGGFNIIGEAR